MTLKDNMVEAIIGAAVLAVFAWFISYVYTHTERGRGGNGYQLVAIFPSVQGINIGSDVRISGVKVGSVTTQDLDPKSFQAKIQFTVPNDIKLPTDTSAKITSEGLLGGNFISLTPGGSEDNLKPGEQIEQTQGSVDLMSLIGQAIYRVGNKAPDPAPPAAKPAQ